MLLVVDDANGGEWLIRDDGSSVPLPRVVENRLAEESRRWFPCYSGLDEGTGVLSTSKRRPCTSGGARGPAHLAATPRPSSRTPASNRGAGNRWTWAVAGFDTSSCRTSVRRTLAAWWVRFYEAGAGAVLGADEGDLLLARAHRTTENLHAFFIDNDLGAAWRSIEQTHPAEAQGGVEVLATPNRSVLLRDFDLRADAARTRIWRLGSLEAGDWTLVSDTGPLTWTIDTGHMHPLVVVGKRLMAGTLFSDDDGRTWTVVDRWR